MAFADDYISVNERVDKFLERYPDGRVQTEIAHLSDALVIMKAIVYRTADDVRPGIAHSQLSIPGKTNFTRDSEVENAETSAIGRALAFMGFETKKGIASREEVQSRQHEAVRAPQHTPSKWSGTELKALLEGNDLTMLDLTPVLGMTVSKENYAFTLTAHFMEHPDDTLETLVKRAAGIKHTPAKQPALVGGE